MGKRSGPKGRRLGGFNSFGMPRGMREKLIVAFCLMSIVPLLVLGYVVTNYVFPHLEAIGDLSVVIGLALVITLLGFFVVRGLVLPVVKLASEAQALAAGRLEHPVDVTATDEVGALGTALNQIASRVRENMAQLRLYGEQTKHLNLEINRRVLALSNLLQVSNLIAQSAKVEEILQFTMEKLTHLEEAELNCLLVPAEAEGTFRIQVATGIDAAQVQSLSQTRCVAPWLKRILQENLLRVIDAKAPPRDRELLGQLFGMTNGVCQPLISLGKGAGILISANRKEQFTYGEDALQIFKVFAKQMAIAIENDRLMKRTEELKVIDELTGLYNAGYMKGRLEEEIRRAIRYHRSCSLVVFNLDDFKEFQELYGGIAAEGILRQAARILKSQASEVDRVGRTGSDEFMMILPERNKREAIEWADAVRKRVEESIFTNGGERISRSLTLSGGVSENPLDGETAEELSVKAAEAMKLAKMRGKNRVVAS